MASGPSPHTDGLRCSERWRPALGGVFPALLESLKKHFTAHLDWQRKSTGQVLDIKMLLSFFMFTLDCVGFPSIGYAVAKYQRILPIQEIIHLAFDGILK